MNAGMHAQRDANPAQSTPPRDSVQSGNAHSNGISHAELADIMQAFDQASARLAQTHEQLQSQVAQLRAELADARVQVERSKHLALLGEMAAGIAHEVRNPLGSILLYARMLQQDLADSPAQRQVADKIAASVKRLEAVVGDVLAFSRQTQVRCTTNDAAEFLEAALHTAADDSPLWRSITARVQAAEPCVRVVADHGLLTQAIVNLIRNAAEAMADNPPERARELTLSADTRSVRSSTGARQRMTALLVHDTGPGIDPQVASKLFTPFFTTRAQGTGLGLAIVHRVIDAHGGRVSIEARKHGGKVVGATAQVLLPIES